MSRTTKVNSSGQPGVPRGRTSSRSRLQASALPDIRQRLAAGEAYSSIAADHRVSASAIKAILYGRNWNQGEAEEIGRVRAERRTAQRAQRAEHGDEAHRAARPGAHLPRNEVRRTEGDGNLGIAQEQVERNRLNSAFGRWLEQTRFERKMNLAALAGLTGISLATISRLERGEGQVTLMTAFRLCEGLQVSLPALANACLGTTPSMLKATQNRGHQHVLTAHDLHAFLDYCRRDWHAGLLLLVAALNRGVSGSPVIKKPDRTVEEVEMLLTKASSPSSVLRDLPELEASELWDVARRGGVVTYHDTGLYLLHLRLAAGLTLQNLQQAVAIPFTVLGRLEQGVIERIKLATVIALDRYWMQEGRVLALFWSAAHYAHVASSCGEKERKLLACLVQAYRRIQQDAQDEVWLVSLREAITEGREELRKDQL